MDKHESQTDYKTGFGGKFGVLQDRQDKVGSNLFVFLLWLSSVLTFLRFMLVDLLLIVPAHS